MTRPILTALAFLSAVSRLAAAHLPAVPTDVTEFTGRIALLVNTRYFDPLLEIRGRLEGVDGEFRYRSLTVGSYVRPHPNVKLGLFYRLQSGARHEDDWIENPAPPPAWIWQDTTARLEHELVADISPRFLLPFLPGRDWVFMLKARYHLSSYGLEQSVLLRPQLTWFLMVDREPLLSLSLAYGLYFPLNFGTTPLYRHAPYFEILYHLGPNLKLELTGSYDTVSWGASQALLDSGEPIPPGFYPVRYRTYTIGLGVLVTLAR